MKKLYIGLILMFFVFSLSSCKKEEIDINNITNSDFETGDLSGWTITGEAFTDSITNKVLFDGIRKYMHSNTYHLNTTTLATGTIESNQFILGGLGFVTFLIGGDATYDETYVAIIDSETDEILLQENNYSFDGNTFTDNYVRIVMDASEYLGRNLQVRIVDNSTVGYMNIDDIDVFIETEDELNNYYDNSLVRLGIRTDNLLDSAEFYINQHKQIIDQSKRYTFHVMGEIGWINDPNGFVYYNNEYHLFYQHNPYSALWGPMHWGHVRSDDLIKWEYLPVAVAPIVFDAGGGAAFSGSAIDVNGDLFIMYTENWMGYQHQVIAKSEDGITFEKINDGLAVIDASDLPWYTDPIDFRDPKIWKQDDKYYAVIGSRQINGFGQVLMFESDNLIDWTLTGPMIQGTRNTISKLGYMFECPDVFELNDKEILIMSPQQIPGHRNNHGTVYITGDLNYETGMLENYYFDDIKEIDYGFDFYAPQTMIDAQGRRIMVAWMQSWNRSALTTGLGWAGAMTVPRVLTIDEHGNLFQYPVVELNNYRKNEYIYNNKVDSEVNIFNDGNIADIELSFSPSIGQSGITVYADESGYGTDIYYLDGYVYLDRTESMGGRFSGEINNITKALAQLNENGEITLRIILDKQSIEVFINYGAQAMTSTVVYHESNDSIFLFADNETNMKLNMWDLVVE